MRPLPLILLIAAAIALSACALYTLNQQTRPQFNLPRDEPYPDGMSMETWMRKMHITPTAQP